MKKILLFIVVLFHLYNFCLAQDKKNKKIKINYKGDLEYIELEESPADSFIQYPENKNIGKIRRSVGIEPVFRGYFSYCFDYNFKNIKKGALYQVFSKKIKKMKKIIVPLYGDKSNNYIRIRIIDKQGEIFTTKLHKNSIDWKNKWKFIYVDKNDFEYTEWASNGDKNRKIDFPIILRRLYLYSAKKAANKGKIFFDDIIIGK